MRCRGAFWPTRSADMNVHARPRWSVSRPRRPRCATTVWVSRWRPDIGWRASYASTVWVGASSQTNRRRVTAQCDGLSFDAADEQRAIRTRKEKNSRVCEGHDSWPRPEFRQILFEIWVASAADLSAAASPAYPSLRGYGRAETADGPRRRQSVSHMRAQMLANTRTQQTKSKCCNQSAGT